MKNVVQENEKAISGEIKIDEKEIRTHLVGLVRQSVGRLALLFEFDVLIFQSSCADSASRALQSQ